MKKTIAILLVLVLAGVGLFAATDTAAMKISVSVTPTNLIAITAVTPTTALSASTTLAQFQAVQTQSVTDALTTDAKAVSVSASTGVSYVPVGYLNYYSNKKVGFSTTFKATELADNGTTPVTTRIQYTVRVGSITQVSAASGSEIASDSIVLVPANSLTTIAGTKTIEVDIDDTTFSNAAVATGAYIGTITFTYETV